MKSKTVITAFIALLLSNITLAQYEHKSLYLKSEDLSIFPTIIDTLTNPYTIVVQDNDIEKALVKCQFHQTLCLVWKLK